MLFFLPECKRKNKNSPETIHSRLFLTREPERFAHPTFGRKFLSCSIGTGREYLYP